jgi:UDP-2-acetamido-3-amino-2,3-dideoxy-glucuronate N-acetyltransferase
MWSSFDVMVDVTRPSVGILGGGVWGSNLIRNFADLGVLRGVCDPDPAALTRIGSAYPMLQLESDPFRFLNEPYDALVIATPAETHAELATAAMRLGKHVFVEKPLALTPAEGLELSAIAEETGVVLFVGHLLLYHPAVRRLLELVRAGEIGEPWHVRSRRLSFGRLRRHENVWWSFAPHDVSVVLATFGAEPVASTSFLCGSLSDTIADVAYAQFTFPGGRSAHVEVNWLDPDKGWRLEVFGTAGVLSIRDGREGAVLTITRCGARPASESGNRLWREAAAPVAFEASEPLRAEVTAFLDAITKGAAFPTDARHGVAVLRALALADDGTTRPHFLEIAEPA